MFEVGKKYKASNTGNIVNCLGVGKTTALLEHNGREWASSQDHWYIYSEYKEPIKHVRYYNMYPKDISADHATRKAADEEASDKRIGCIRVEFTEGTYDE